MNFSGRKSVKCPGRLIKPIDNDDDRHFKTKGSHIHKPDARKVSTKMVMTNIKHFAKTTHSSTKEIIAAATTNLKVATAAKLPTVKLMKRTAVRVRVKENNPPKQPKKISELHLEGEFCVTNNGDNFILYDSGVYDGEQDDRIIIFGTQKNHDFLATCTEVYMDGTFKISPALFKQLYTLHGKRHKTLIEYHSILFVYY